MNDKPCPLCLREMTAIETHAGRGELYCVHCDLVIGGNEAKTPDELMGLLRLMTCSNISKYTNVFKCSACGFEYDFVTDPYQGPHYCPNCGRRIEVTA